MHNRLGGPIFETSRGATAKPLDLPIGIQPYTVREDLKVDFEGTLRKIAAMGYREIEVNGDYHGRTPADLRKILGDVGLRAPSAHYSVPKDDAEWAQNIEGAHCASRKSQTI